jgi:uncharacterized membrane protein YvbJ
MKNQKGCIFIKELEESILLNNLSNIRKITSNIDRVIKIIDSTITDEHFKSVKNLIENYENIHKEKDITNKLLKYWNKHVKSLS